MNKKVAVLTDSTASIPEEILQELNIHTVAYYIHRGQEVLRDLVTIQREEFLQWLATARFLPTTASPGPGDYIQAYEELVEAGHEEIVSIHMTSKASGAYPGCQRGAIHVERDTAECAGGGHRYLQCGPVPGVDGHRSRPGSPGRCEGE